MITDGNIKYFIEMLEYQVLKINDKYIFIGISVYLLKSNTGACEILCSVHTSWNLSMSVITYMENDIQNITRWIT